MDIKKFEESVKNLAHQRVNEKVEKFRRSLRAALKDLTGDPYISKDDLPDSDRNANHVILANIVEKSSIATNKGWPGMLWRKEEDKVRKELFDMMDTVQRALLAPEPSEEDCIPADPAPSSDPLGDL